MPPKPGETWTTKIAVNNPAGGNQTVETTYTFDGTREVDGTTYAVIKPTMKMDLASNPMMEMKMKEQKTDGEVLFDSRPAGCIRCRSIRTSRSTWSRRPDDARHDRPEDRSQGDPGRSEDEHREAAPKSKPNRPPPISGGACCAAWSARATPFAAAARAPESRRPRRGPQTCRPRAADCRPTCRCRC